MNTKNKFHGIILGIYADMIGIKYEKAFLHLIRNKYIIDAQHRSPLAKVLRETRKFEGVGPKWQNITDSDDLWSKLQDHLATKPHKFSDDTVLTCATIAALNDNLSNPNFKKFYFEFGNDYRHAGFGPRFKQWINETEPGPAYGADTNGAIMRISPIGYIDIDPTEKWTLAYNSASVTHNTVPAQNSAVQVVKLIDSIRNDNTLKPSTEAFNLLYDDHKDLINNLPQLSLEQFDFKCESTYWNVLSVLWHSISPDNLIHNVIKTGGDTDTIGMIAGSIYGAQKDFTVPEYMQHYVYENLPVELRELVF